MAATPPAPASAPFQAPVAARRQTSIGRWRSWRIQREWSSIGSSAGADVSDPLYGEIETGYANGHRVSGPAGWEEPRHPTIASPWIFGFSEVSDAKTIAIVVGVAMLLSGAMTQWRYSLVKLIPLSAHFATDLLLGAVLVLSPFIFGFSDHGGATRWAIVVGAIELITALSTRWVHEDADARVGRAHPAA
jgi:hypothetical protein